MDLLLLFVFTAMCSTCFGKLVQHLVLMELGNHIKYIIENEIYLT